MSSRVMMNNTRGTAVRRASSCRCPESGVGSEGVYGKPGGARQRS
jgi:hypothetical protein